MACFDPKAHIVPGPRVPNGAHRQSEYIKFKLMMCLAVLGASLKLSYSVTMGAVSPVTTELVGSLKLSYSVTMGAVSFVTEELVGWFVGCGHGHGLGLGGVGVASVVWGMGEWMDG